MHRKRSIGILFVFIILILTFVIINKISYHIALTELLEEQAKEYTALDDFYWIESGKITPYFCINEKAHKSKLESNVPMNDWIIFNFVSSFKKLLVELSAANAYNPPV